MNFPVFCSIFLIFLLSFSLGGSGETFVEEGNKSYDNDNYIVAIDEYEKALEKECQGNPDVYFNLGNAYFRMGNIGKAILNYKRTLKINPRSPEAKANLKYVSSFLQDRIISVRKPIALRIFSGPSSYFSMKEIVYLCAFIFLAAMGLIALSFFVQFKRVVYYFASALIIMWLFFFSSFLVGRAINGKKQAIVLVKESSLRYGPGEKETLKLRVHEGTEIFISEKRGKWYYGKLIDGQNGWIFTGDVEII